MFRVILILHSAGDLTAAQAASADVNMGRSTVYDGLDALHIGLPGTIGASVGVADFDAERHILITKLTLCHSLKHLLACVSLKDSSFIITDTPSDCKCFLNGI